MGNLILKGNQKNRQELLVSMKEIYKKLQMKENKELKMVAIIVKKNCPNLTKDKWTKHY